MEVVVLSDEVKDQQAGLFALIVDEVEAAILANRKLMRKLSRNDKMKWRFAKKKVSLGSLSSVSDITIAAAGQNSPASSFAEAVRDAAWLGDNHLNMWSELEVYADALLAAAVAQRLHTRSYSALGFLYQLAFLAEVGTLAEDAMRDEVARYVQRPEGGAKTQPCSE